MSNLLAIALAFIAGCVIPIQAGANAAMRRALANPVQAALMSFLVGTVTLVAVSLAWHRSLPSPGAALRAPWWAWTGGFCGAAFVFLAVLTTEKLGPLTVILVALAGQVLLGAIIDHFGWLESTVRTLTPARGAGILLIFSGVYLVQRTG